MALNGIDDDMILDAEKSVKRKKGLMKWGILAASMILACLLVPPITGLFVGDRPSDISPISTIVSGSFVGDRPSDISPISTIVSGSKLSGKQELTWGTMNATAGQAEIIGVSFTIQTVVEAKVLEILPDTYYDPVHARSCRIARLSVVDAIRGEGLPKEILFRYSYYDDSVFEGYDTFIFSLSQIGIENYMLINETEKEVTYFPHMFEVANIDDLGYGSVLAFQDGMLDEGFWDRVTYLQYDAGAIPSMLDDPDRYHYPVGHQTALAQAKKNIKKLAEDGENPHLSILRCDYVTADDIFVSEESKCLRAFLTSSEKNVFAQVLMPYRDRVIATYTRMVNGFFTEESYIVNDYSKEIGNVVEKGCPYTEKELETMPDIASVLDKMVLTSLQPPHTDPQLGAQPSHIRAKGEYKRANGDVYGIIRINWTLRGKKGYYFDDCYYVYDTAGRGAVLEREEMVRLFGDSFIVGGLSYNVEYRILY